MMHGQKYIKLLLLELRK